MCIWYTNLSGSSISSGSSTPLTSFSFAHDYYVVWKTFRSRTNANDAAKVEVKRRLFYDLALLM